MRNKRTKQDKANATHARTREEAGELVAHDIALAGRRQPAAAKNSLMFFAHVEGVEDYGRVRGANGIRWKVA